MSAIEVIPIKEVPVDIRMHQEHEEIYRMAHRLKTLGEGVAIRVKLGSGEKVHLMQKKAHAHFRSDRWKLRTRQRKGYLYMWLDGAKEIV